MSAFGDRLSSFLLKPIEPEEESLVASPLKASAPAQQAAGVGRRLSVVESPPARSNRTRSLAAVGFRQGCGTTTVALGLARALAVRSGEPAIVVTSDALAGAEEGRNGVRNRAAKSLQGELGARGMVGAQVPNLGGVCLAELPSCGPDVLVEPHVTALDELAAGRAPLVWDIGAVELEPMRFVLDRIDTWVVVAHRDADHELVELATAAEIGGPRRQLLVINGADGSGWGGAETICLPRTRLNAWHLRRGGRPRGQFARSLDSVAEWCDS